MFDHAPQNNELRRVMDACLPGLENNPDFDRDVLKQVRGEGNVKKKLSVGFVLIIVLVLAIVTALAAITLNAFYENAIQKEGESGLIQDWSASDKVALVDWMVEAGVELDGESVAQLHDENLSEEQQNALAMEIINGYYPARDGILTSVDIIAKEKGPFEYWSLEDKAWFSELMLEYQPDKIGGIDLLPDDEDITQEQAIEIMYAYYTDNYGLARSDFDESKMSIAFKEQTWDDGSGPERLTTWEMNLWLKDDPYPMGISILPDGTIKQATGPYVRTWRDDWYDTNMADDFWTIEGLYQFQQEWGPRVAQINAGNEKLVGGDLAYLLSLSFGLPTADDITRDEAYAIAVEAILAQQGWTEEKLSHFNTREAYRTDSPSDPIYWFTFVYFLEDPLEWETVYALHESGEVPRRVIVKIHAKTGDLAEIYEESTTSGTDRLGM